jgi:arsenate reductase-like glutaredoxin family protein
MREFLSQAGVTTIDCDFFAEPFTEESLRTLLGGTLARDAFAAQSPTVKKLGLDLDTLSDDELLRLMVEEPRLIRRPIVVIEGQLIPGATEKSLAGLLG